MHDLSQQLQEHSAQDMRSSILQPVRGRPDQQPHAQMPDLLPSIRQDGRHACAPLNGPGRMPLCNPSPPLFNTRVTIPLFFTLIAFIEHCTIRYCLFLMAWLGLGEPIRQGWRVDVELVTTNVDASFFFSGLDGGYVWKVVRVLLFARGSMRCAQRRVYTV